MWPTRGAMDSALYCSSKLSVGAGQSQPLGLRAPASLPISSSSILRACRSAVLLGSCLGTSMASPGPACHRWTYLSRRHRMPGP